MTSEEFRRHGHRTIDWIADYLEHSDRYPILPRMKPGDLADALPATGPEHGEPMEAILADFEKLIVPATTHWNHPGFMAYFGISGSAPGVIAETLAAALNVNGMLWKSGPSVVELEEVTLRWLREWSGLPKDWFGMILDTASTSTMHAIAAAREKADPECRTRGASPGLIVYTSQQSHSSIEKGAISLGMGQQNVRQVPVDSEFRMSPDALAHLIEQDIAAGLKPCCVAATIGTTGTTSVDPVPAIAEICRKHGIWLHVDAAYAGSAAVAPEFHWAFQGCEHADSMVTNPHKWLFTQVDCSAFYTRHPDVLRRAYSLVPDILYTTHDPRAINLMDYGVPLGRRFRALKLWFVMRSYGREGLAALIREHVRLAQELAVVIAADARFEITAPHPFSVVCFRYKGADEENRQIQETVNSSGEVFMSGTVLNGRFSLRLAIGNIATTGHHVRRAWELICAAIPQAG